MPTRCHSSLRGPALPLRCPFAGAPALAPPPVLRAVVALPSVCAPPPRLAAAGVSGAIVCSLDFTTAFLSADCNTQVYAKQGPYREIKLDDNGVRCEGGQGGATADT